MTAFESTAWSVNRPNDRDDVRRLLSTCIPPRLKLNSARLTAAIPSASNICQDRRPAPVSFLLRSYSSLASAFRFPPPPP
jgi:hypothetical protein